MKLREEQRKRILYKYRLGWWGAHLTQLWSVLEAQEDKHEEKASTKILRPPGRAATFSVPVCSTHRSGR